MSGTQIIASEKVVVISGHECANVPDRSTLYCDYIGDQMIPTDRLKKAFIVSYMSPRPSFTVQIISQENATVVTIYKTLGQQNETITMNQGEAQIRTYTDNDIISILATNGIIVSQYNHGSSIDKTIGDPSSTIVPGINQYDNNYIFSTIDQISTHSVCIIMHTAYDFNGLMLDGISQGGNPTVPITVPEWGSYKIMFIALSTGRHTLTHMNEKARFGAIVYGYLGNAEYSFPVGMRL